MTRGTFLVGTVFHGALALVLLAACGGETPPNEPEVVKPTEPVETGPKLSGYEPEDAPAAPFALLEIFTSEG